jgi:hypothetical protein
MLAALFRSAEDPDAIRESDENAPVPLYDEGYGVALGVECAWPSPGGVDRQD